MSIIYSSKKLQVALLTWITAIMGQTFAWAQPVTITPTFATQNDNITVVFDASQGNGALVGQTIVYAHTGVITDQSSTPTSWRYVQGTWGTDDAKVKMTNLGNNKFSLSYNITSFYGVPQNEKVLKLAFVFRNQSGSIVGRATDGSDIFVPISDGSFQASFTGGTFGLFALLSDTIRIQAKTSATASIKIFKGSNLLTSVGADTNLSYQVSASTLGKGNHIYILEATSGNSTAYDTFTAVVYSSPDIAVLPPGIKDGINYTSDTSVTLVLFAPFKQFVFVLGDFNDWSFRQEYFMKKTPDGNRYWIEINGLQKGREYRFQYAIDKTQLRIADIYADKILDPWNDSYIPSVTYPGLIPYPTGKTTDPVSVLQSGQTPFNWKHSSFTRPAQDKLFIYELLVRDFTGRHDFQTLKDTLDYLQRLGVNAIELMPINEFEGNESWGYNPSFYFAVDKYYGTKEAFKTFVDECHRRGIAVILDIVLNHSFGQNPQVRMYFNPNAGQFGQPTANNPWFNETDRHPFGVGYDYNHESYATQSFVDSVLHYWLTEYKIDGYRFDLSKGFTQNNTFGNVAAWSAYDPSRVNLLKRMYDRVRTYDTDCYMILEHLADNSEEIILANYGFMLWGNLNYNFNEATMGFLSNSNLNWGNYKTRNWAYPNLVTYSESHDEERLMYKNMQFGNANANYSAKEKNNALTRMAASMCLLIPLKGPKMIWQFGELGYDISINQNGRTGNKPILWNYQLEPQRQRIYSVTAALNQIKSEYSQSYRTDNYIYNTGGAIKFLKTGDTSLYTISMANFDISPAIATPVFPHTGWWYDYLHGDSILVNDVNQTISLTPGAYRYLIDKRIRSSFQMNTSDAHKNLNIQALIFPNPIADYINIDIPEHQELKSLRILNTKGQILYSETPEAGIRKKVLHTSSLQLKSGIYFLQIEFNQSTTTHKILIN
jgi:glycosidase